MAMSPADMQAAIAGKLRERTGKSIDEWVGVARRKGLSTRKALVDWLMKEQGLGRVAANMVASRVEGQTGYSDPAALLAGMFAGPKAALRRLYDELVKAATSLGADVQVMPCRTQVTLRRTRQFAWIKASSATRLDLGLALPGIKPAGRLLPVAGTNEQDRVRLRIAVASIEEIDAEVKRWLKTAYDFDER